MERTYKEALAHDLVFYATALLSMAGRLRGDAPALHNNAEFQALDIMRKETDRKIEVYRKAFAPFGVAQPGETGFIGK